jgi:TolA-binding protein
MHRGVSPMPKSVVIGVCALLLPAGVQAQSVEGRVGKLESEMRAVQRKVFPGGAGQLLQPEVSGPQASNGPGPGSPATSAIADLSSRVASLEQQMAGLTGQIEQNTYKTRQLQDAFDAYKRSNDARVKSIEGGALPRATGDTDPGLSAPATAPRPTSRPETATKPAASGTDRARLVAAVEKPATGDAAEDGYLYGYRLWSAKLYPEAQVQLKKVVADYPKSKRASYAQNLLGRAYLDEGKPSLASMAFYDNYKKMPDGERAPDSLLNLGAALTKLNKPADACKVYDELNDVYGAKMSPAMKADVAKGRAAAKCS